MIAMARAELERRIGAKLVKGWVLDGVGPARYGWGSVWPCRTRWEGRTLAEISLRLKIEEGRNS